MMAKTKTFTKEYYTRRKGQYDIDYVMLNKAPDGAGKESS